ncbi:MAG: transposase [Deltaproteobacteria bacterium]|nr:transposase [Deltaproteobacteria bacterium]
MPRKARIDAPGALHHIIVRGIERRKIFFDDTDLDHFLDRLSAVLDDTQTACFAWALIPNHFHLLLRTGNAAISRVMQRILTGYAITFNRRHHRHGHLFQNRYKSILCQEDAYLLELVRYIHLNPLRANIVRNLKELQAYPYSGHSAFFKKKYRPWQDTDYVLKRFNPSVLVARRRYREFVEKGMDQGRRDELVGGGLIRSSGGWAAVKALQKAGIFQKNDERILGDGEFVEKVLSFANEKMERSYRLQVQGVDFQVAIRRAGELTGIDPDAILSRDRGRRTVQARSLACYWAAEDLGLKQPEIGLKLGMTQAAVSLAIKRGKLLAAENNMSLE